MNFIAYKITCVPTGRFYIGITTQPLHRRWRQHVSTARSGSATRIARAIAKYGAQSCTVEHIASSFSVEDLKQLEMLLIEQYHSAQSGLNITHGGDGVLGIKHSEEAKSKMRAKAINAGKDPRTRRRRAEAQKNVWAQKSAEQIEQHRRRSATVLAFVRPITIAAEPAVGPGKGHNMRIKTHCPQGHEYSMENTLINHRGSRVCRTCKRAARNAARDERRRAAREAV